MYTMDTHKRCVFTHVRRRRRHRIGNNAYLHTLNWADIHWQTKWETNSLWVNSLSSPVFFVLTSTVTLNRFLLSHDEPTQLRDVVTLRQQTLRFRFHQSAKSRRLNVNICKTTRGILQESLFTAETRQAAPIRQSHTVCLWSRVRPLYWITLQLVNVVDLLTHWG